MKRARSETALAGFGGSARVMEWAPVMERRSERMSTDETICQLKSNANLSIRVP